MIWRILERPVTYTCREKEAEEKERKGEAASRSGLTNRP